MEEGLGGAAGRAYKALRYENKLLSEATSSWGTGQGHARPHGQQPSEGTFSLLRHGLGCTPAPLQETSPVLCTSTHLPPLALGFYREPSFLDLHSSYFEVSSNFSCQAPHPLLTP